MHAIHAEERPAALPCDLSSFHQACCAPGAGALKAPLLRLVGLAAVGLGAAGLFLPLLPTTPFLLVAAWAFGRSSPRLHRWLHGHRRLGPVLQAWEQRRAVPRGAKVVAVGGMSASWGLLSLQGVSVVALAGAGLCMAAVAVWLVSRPS